MTKRSVLGVVFLTVFLDIVGFSIVFPLFPGMLDHYLTQEGPDSLIGRLASWLGGLAGADQNAVATLFGGLLGSIYGILQFLFTTFWGGLSDRRGRRPTLLFTLVGTVLGYVLWMFAGSFLVLILSRVLSGIMAGNISVASAAIADTTEGKDRAKGMGIVGMAIGLGFILGPAIGGFCASFLVGSGGSATGALALNPFSGAALASVILALINLLWVALRFPETLAAGHGAAEERTLNPFARLRRINVPGVARTDIVYLLYLIAFAAAEFTLTFLAVERLTYTTRDLAWMFVFVGLIIAVVQGGMVRRLAPRFGERYLALFGMGITAPAFAFIGMSHSTLTLYVGLACMAIGSSCVMPCLSALVSRYAPNEHQGLALGTFRSMGSLSRAVGPILGSILYWKFGSQSPYAAGAFFLALPILLALGLPAVPKDEPAPTAAGR